MKLKKITVCMLSLSVMSFTLANPAAGVYPHQQPSPKQLARQLADSLRKEVGQLHVSGALLEHRGARLQLIAQSN